MGSENTISFLAPRPSLLAPVNLKRLCAAVMLARVFRKLTARSDDETDQPPCAAAQGGAIMASAARHKATGRSGLVGNEVGYAAKKASSTVVTGRQR